MEISNAMQNVVLTFQSSLSLESAGLIIMSNMLFDKLDELALCLIK